MAAGCTMNSARESKMGIPEIQVSSATVTVDLKINPWNLEIACLDRAIWNIWNTKTSAVDSVRSPARCGSINRTPLPQTDRSSAPPWAAGPESGEREGLLQ